MTTWQALAAGTIAVASVVGCSAGDGTRVRRETGVIRDRPTIVEQHGTTQAPGSPGTVGETIRRERDVIEEEDD